MSFLLCPGDLQIKAVEPETNTMMVTAIRKKYYQIKSLISWLNEQGFQHISIQPYLED